MYTESTHAIHYHLTRIASEIVNAGAENAKKYPFSESFLRQVLNERPISKTGSDASIADELRFNIECSMRLLLMMQRRTDNFKL